MWPVIKINLRRSSPIVFEQGNGDQFVCWCRDHSQPAIACSMLTIETLEQSVQYF